MQISDVLGLGKLATKLLEQLGTACGYIFRPVTTVINAKATASAIKIIEDSSENVNIIDVENGEIRVRVKKEENFAVDVVNVVNQEMKKQENVNSIVNKAVEILEKNSDKYLDVRLDDEWVLNFIEGCKYVSDEEMQNTWAKILTDESTGNAKFSIKTLQILRYMSKSDAELFLKVASCTFKWLDLYVIVNLDDSKNVYNTNTVEMLYLNDLGLVHESEKYLNLKKSGNAFLSKGEYFYVVENIGQGEKNMSFHVLSKAGAELMNFVEKSNCFSEADLIKIFKIDNNSRLLIHKKIDEKNYNPNCEKIVSIS